MSCAHHVKEDPDEYHIVSSHMLQMAELVCTVLTSKDYKHLKLQMPKKRYTQVFLFFSFKKERRLPFELFI